MEHLQSLLAQQESRIGLIEQEENDILTAIARECVDAQSESSEDDEVEFENSNSLEASGTSSTLIHVTNRLEVAGKGAVGELPIRKISASSDASARSPTGFDLCHTTVNLHYDTHQGRPAAIRASPCIAHRAIVSVKNHSQHRRVQAPLFGLQLRSGNER